MVSQQNGPQMSIANLHQDFSDRGIELGGTTVVLCALLLS